MKQIYSNAFYAHCDCVKRCIEIDLLVIQATEEIWDILDKDGEMKLNLEDAKEFVKDCDKILMDGDNPEEFRDEVFANLFNRFDEDGFGYIKKE